MQRRDYVLSSMLKHGFINDIQYQQAIQESPRLNEEPHNPSNRAPYFTEAVRQDILDRYGESLLYEEGLQVWTTCDVNMQNKAAGALHDGVLQWEKREKRPPGLIKRLTNREAKDFLHSKPKESFKVGDIVNAIVVRNEVSKDPAAVRGRPQRTQEFQKERSQGPELLPCHGRTDGL